MDVPSNRDLLAWFDDDECEDCPTCGDHARVTMAEVLASFCLACGGVWLGNVRLDVDRRLYDVDVDASLSA